MSYCSWGRVNPNSRACYTNPDNFSLQEAVRFGTFKVSPLRYADRLQRCEICSATFDVQLYVASTTNTV